jgi:hypothetical protein
MCRFEMALVVISYGTWLQVLINSCSTGFTMEGKGSIVMYLLSDSSTTPTMVVSKAVQTLTKSLQTSNPLVSSSPLLALLHILTIIMPKERRKLK